MADLGGTVAKVWPSLNGHMDSHSSSFSGATHKERPGLPVRAFPVVAQQAKQILAENASAREFEFCPVVGHQMAQDRAIKTIAS